MHDGNSLGTDAAIKRHAGEATTVRHRYEQLTAPERKQIQNVLGFAVNRLFEDKK